MDRFQLAVQGYSSTCQTVNDNVNATDVKKKEAVFENPNILYCIVLNLAICTCTTTSIF